MSDSTPVEVDVNTDDLDEFEALMTGKADVKAPAEDKPVKEEIIEEKADEATPDDDAVADEDEPEDADEAEEADSEDDDAEEEDEDILKPKPKNRKTFQERINELTREKREAERRENELLRRLSERQEVKPEPKPERKVAIHRVDADAPDPDALDDNGEPIYPLGEFDRNFVADLTRYTVEQGNKAWEAQQAEKAEAQKQEAAQAELQKTWAGKLADVEKEIPDLRPALASLENTLADVDPNLGAYLATTLMQMDAGPQVLYYLANHADEVDRILAAGPVGATLALGRLEAKIQSALAKREGERTVRPTAAPPAIERLARGSGVKKSVAADTDDLDAFERMFSKR